MIKPKISIIIPVYNTEKYLKRCLNSLVRQTLKDIEVILINDGSLDNSSNICDEYAEKDSRFKVVHKENGGASKSRNIGLNMACGEYICFVDSDDYIDTNGFEEMYNIATEKNVDIVLSNHFYGESNINNVKFPKNVVVEKDEIKKMLVNSNTDFFLPFLWRNIFKNTEEQQKIRFKTNLKYGEDSLYNLTSYLSANRMYCIDKAFYHYMQNDTSTMNSKKKKFLYYLNNLYKEKMKLYEEGNLNELKPDLYNYTIQHTLIILIDEASKYSNIFKLRQILKEIRKSKMVEESFNNYNIDINKVKASKLNRRIIKSLKDKNYNLASFYLVTKKVLKR